MTRKKRMSLQGDTSNLQNAAQSSYARKSTALARVTGAPEAYRDRSYSDRLATEGASRDL